MSVNDVSEGSVEKSFCVAFYVIVHFFAAFHLRKESTSGVQEREGRKVIILLLSRFYTLTRIYSYRNVKFHFLSSCFTFLLPPSTLVSSFSSHFFVFTPPPPPHHVVSPTFISMTFCTNTR